MLDLHALSSGGSTAGLGAIGTILLGSDGAATAGVPVATNARLVGWGVMSTIADTIQECVMHSQDLVDNLNGEDFNPGTGSILGSFYKFTNVAFKTGARSFLIDQNTAAANAIAYMLDWYAGKGESVSGSFVPENNIPVNVTSGAITAITWQNAAVAPANPIPNGKYAILGASYGALTNYGLCRFQHADFQGLFPGFPVVDQTNVAIQTGYGLCNRSEIWDRQGFQFVSLSKILNQPMCPVFNVTSAGTGLRVWSTAITADTPVIQINLQKIA